MVRVRVLEEITLASHNLLDETVYDEILGQTVLDGLPPREQIMVMDSRVRALTRSGDRAAAHAAALEAIRIAEAVDDPVLKGDAHLILAGELMEARDLDSAIREALVAYQFASVAGNIETAVRGATGHIHRCMTMLASMRRRSRRHERREPMLKTSGWLDCKGRGLAPAWAFRVTHAGRRVGL